MTLKMAFVPDHFSLDELRQRISLNQRVAVLDCERVINSSGGKLQTDLVKEAIKLAADAQSVILTNISVLARVKRKNIGLICSALQHIASIYDVYLFGSISYDILQEIAAIGPEIVVLFEELRPGGMILLPGKFPGNISIVWISFLGKNPRLEVNGLKVSDSRMLELFMLVAQEGFAYSTNINAVRIAEDIIRTNSFPTKTRLFSTRRGQLVFPNVTQIVSDLDGLLQLGKIPGSQLDSTRYHPQIHALLRATDPGLIHLNQESERKARAALKALEKLREKAEHTAAALINRQLASWNR